jgi:alkylation response protein AidB-like acyl-CoA dehydrogenase
MSDSATVEVTSAEEVVERVRRLVPQLRASAEATEHARRALPENIQALTDAGVYRLTAPRRHGGLEASLDVLYDVQHEIARGCPSTAWTTSLHLACTWWGGLFTDEAQDEIFAAPDTRIAAVLAPTGRGRRTDDGIVVNGRWAFNTGCHYCTWGGMTTMVEEPDGSVAPYVALMPYTDMTILDDWDAMGMAGTGSNTTVAEDVFVPAHRMLPVSALLTGRYPSERNRDNPYFGLPAVPFFVAASSGPLVGTARGAMELFRERLPGRPITYTEYADQSLAPLTHQQVATAQMKIEAAEMFARRVNATVTEHAGVEFPTLERVQVRAWLGQVALLSREAVQTLFEASGASAIQHSVPIQRHLRDVQSLAIHAIIQPTTVTELYGRVLLGLGPNTPFI